MLCREVVPVAREVGGEHVETTGGIEAWKL